MLTMSPMTCVLTANAAALAFSAAGQSLSFVTQFSLPDGAFDVLADGRLLGLSPGGEVLVQNGINSGSFSTTNTIAPVNGSGFAPSFLRVSPDGSRVAVGNNEFGASNAVLVYDAAELILGLGAGTPVVPMAEAITPNFDADWTADGTGLFVSGAVASTFQTVVNRVDLSGATPTVSTAITPAGLFSGGVDVDGSTLLVGAGDSGRVYAFETAAFPSVGSLPITAGPLVAEANSASTIDTLGDLLLIAGSGDATLIDRATGGPTVLAPAGAGAFYGGYFNPSRNELVVTAADFATGLSTAYVYAIPAPSGGVLGLIGLALLRRRRAAVCAVLAAAPVSAQPFASSVIDYSPQPGLYSEDPKFNDPDRALGAPIGGGPFFADNTSVVTLGGFGGSITLGMPRRVADDPRNRLGLDAIVFGNGFWVGGDPTLRFAEVGLIEIALDANGNRIADDAFFPVEGPFGVSPPLPPAVAGPVIDAGPGATAEIVYGYADCSPVEVLPEGESPSEFYTRPDDPMLVGIDAGTGGGDAFDIRWAIDPQTGQSAGLAGFDFIRITTAVDRTDPELGEASVEIDAVADVRPACPADANLDGMLAPNDLSAWIAAFNARSIVADQNDDGLVTSADFASWIMNFNAGCGS
jgi:hypothetical protein